MYYLIYKIKYIYAYTTYYRYSEICWTYLPKFGQNKGGYIRQLHLPSD